MGITVVGSLNFDLCTYTGRVPASGETITANRFETHPGGKGSNQCNALARLRSSDASYEVRMVGGVGDDSFGVTLKELLEKNGVNISKVATWKNIATGIATILIEEDSGQNRILLTKGANGKTEYTDEQLDKDIFPDKDVEEYVVFQYEIPNPIKIMKWLKKNRPNYHVVYNPSPFQPIEKDDWLLSDILVVNEVEAIQIIESVYPKDEITKYKNDIEKDFINGYKMLCQNFQKTLVNQNNKAAVCITLGSKGVLFSSKTEPEVTYIPSVTGIKVIDTTGAGDTFLGGLITQLLEKKTLKEAATFATKASSLSIQKRGAAESIPTYEEVKAAL